MPPLSLCRNILLLCASVMAVGVYPAQARAPSFSPMRLKVPAFDASVVFPKVSQKKSIKSIDVTVTGTVDFHASVLNAYVHRSGKLVYCGSNTPQCIRNYFSYRLSIDPDDPEFRNDSRTPRMAARQSCLHLQGKFAVKRSALAGQPAIQTSCRSDKGARHQLLRSVVASYRGCVYTVLLEELWHGLMRPSAQFGQLVAKFQFGRHEKVVCAPPSLEPWDRS